MIISKLDAAKRQLEMAIKLYFKDWDPVCIHTLVGAAHEVLMNLANREDKTSLIKQEMLKVVKPESRWEALTVLNSAKNFFKHADRDAKETIEFKPAANDWILWDSVLMYQRMVWSHTEVTQAFNLWFMLHNPSIFPTISEKLIPMIETLKSSWLDNKEEFFKLIMEVGFINHVT